MNTVPAEPLDRIHRAKQKLKRLALCIHQRALRQTRQKIAWAIRHFPEETLALAKETLTRQIQRCGNLPRYRSWTRILTQAPDAIARELLREDARVQQRNCCHPFGGALPVYETNHPRRPH
jgi:hypothetical protein